MSQDFEKHTKMAIDAAQQWEKNMAQAAEELSATEFHDTSSSVLSGLEELNAMRHAQNQTPLDIVAELKSINQRLDSAEKDSRKQTTENRIW